MNCLSSMQIFNSFQFHLAYDLSQLFFEWPGMDFQLSWYIIYDQLSGFQVPFPYTISFPNGQNARVANIIQRILPIVLMTTHPPYPMSNILQISISITNSSFTTPNKFFHTLKIQSFIHLACLTCHFLIPPELILYRHLIPCNWYSDHRYWFPLHWLPQPSQIPESRSQISEYWFRIVPRDQ